MKINHTNTPNIVCPHCGHAQASAYTQQRACLLAHACEITCEQCVRVFICNTRLITRFTTIKKGERDA